MSGPNPGTDQVKLHDGSSFFVGCEVGTSFDTRTEAEAELPY